MDQSQTKCHCTTFFRCVPQRGPLQNISDNSLPLWEDRNDDALCFSYSWSDTRARVPNYANLIPARGHNSGSATTLLRDELQKQEIISSRVSEFLLFSHCTDSTTWSFRHVLLALGTVRFLRIVCNGLCIAQRFHVEDEEQICRIGCPDELDSLSHYNECPLIVRYVFLVGDRLLCNHGEATSLLTWSHRFFQRSLQYGIVAMGVIDVFVHVHSHHRWNLDNPGNFGDCMKGRVRFMTAITPACAHAYQLICLTRHIPVVPNQKFRLPAAKARYPHLPNIRTTTRDKGNASQGWAIYTDMGSRLVDGETLAGWSAVAQSTMEE